MALVVSYQGKTYEKVVVGPKGALGPGGPALWKEQEGRLVWADNCLSPILDQLAMTKGEDEQEIKAT